MPQPSSNHLDIHAPASVQCDARVHDALRSAESGWRNWSGGQRAAPARKRLPADEDELRKLIRESPNVRVVGAGHSFPPLVPTTGTLVSLDRLRGVLDHEDASHQARVWTGTRLFELGPMLQALGQALPNLGDIDRQSVAGVLATATHGTGITLPCIAAGAIALRLVTAGGDVLECSRERDPDLFRAAAVSLGALGVVTQATLQNQPAYRLHERVRVERLDDVLATLDERVGQHRHFELFAFPFGRRAIVKTLDATDEPPTSGDRGADSDDLALGICCELMRLAPPLGRSTQKLVGAVVHPSSRVNWWHRIFASQRNVRFNEMEYQVPAAAGAACLDEVCRTIARAGTRVFFPIEFRFVAADDLWLSPFHGAPGEARCSISVHQYWKQDYRPLFALAEPILRRHDGRPHWGKLHTLARAELEPLYPELPRFLKLRSELDPHGKFLNDYLRVLFGIAA